MSEFCFHYIPPSHYLTITPSLNPSLPHLPCPFFLLRPSPSTPSILIIPFPLHPAFLPSLSCHALVSSLPLIVSPSFLPPLSLYPFTPSHSLPFPSFHVSLLSISSSFLTSLQSLHFTLPSYPSLQFHSSHSPFQTSTSLLPPSIPLTLFPCLTPFPSPLIDVLFYVISSSNTVGMM